MACICSSWALKPSIACSISLNLCFLLSRYLHTCILVRHCLERGVWKVWSHFRHMCEGGPKLPRALQALPTIGLAYTSVLHSTIKRSKLPQLPGLPSPICILVLQPCFADHSTQDSEDSTFAGPACSGPAALDSSLPCHHLDHSPVSRPRLTHP